MKLYGPYRRKDGRWQLTIKKDDGKTTSVSYPKWLYETTTGYSLKDNETIDHKDNNPDNNQLTNLQVLTRKENALKSVVYAEILELTCKVCGNKFKRRKALEIYNRTIRNDDGPFCSKRCVGLIHH